MSVQKIQFTYLILILSLFSIFARAENEFPKKRVEAIQISPDQPVTDEDDQPKPKVGKPKKKTASADVQQKDEAGDTYNFYFQKSPSANKVEQSKEHQKVEQPRESDELIHETKSQPMQHKDFKPSDFDLYVGLFESPKGAGAGLYVGGEYHVSSFFGLELDLMRLAYKSGDNSNSTFSAYGSSDSSQTGSAFGGILLLTFSPVAKSDLRISGLAGVMVANDTITDTSSTFSAYGSNDTSSSSSKVDVLPVVGAQGTFYFSQNMGLQGRILVPTDLKYAQLGLGADFRF